MVNASDGKNHLLRIDQVWAAVSVDEEGNEGICAVQIGDQWMPLIGADEKRLAWMTQQARDIAIETRKPVRIIRLHQREEIETFIGGAAS